MPQIISLVLQLPKKVSTNKIYAGRHWGYRYEIAKLYHESMLPYRFEQVDQYPVRISYDFYFRSKALDTLNCAFMAKCVEDGMASLGVLQGDGPKFVRACSISTQKAARGENDHVVITIEKFREKKKPVTS